MFCPECGHSQTSGELRPCSVCGFPLERVKELVGGENRAASRREAFSIWQRDVNIGAAVMFVGGIVAALWSFEAGRGSREVPLPRAFFMLGFTLAFVLLVSRPLFSAFRKFTPEGKESSAESTRHQDGINLGAILMFIGVMTALLIGSFERPENRFLYTIILMTAGFLLVLVIRNVTQLVQIILRQGSGGEKSVKPSANTEGN